jgi:hypothetical protein
MLQHRTVALISNSKDVGLHIAALLGNVHLHRLICVDGKALAGVQHHQR